LDYIPPELQRDVRQLWKDAGNSGMNQDPRRIRSGGTFMPPSALCGSYVCSIRKTVVRDEYLGAITADEINVQFTYLNWPGLQKHMDSEGTRYETVASWQRSVLEHKRQLYKLMAMSESGKQVIQEATELWQEKKSELIDIFQSQLSFIESHGDWSLEQFEHYARQHKESGMGYKRLTWSSILRDQDKLVEAHKQYYNVVRNLIEVLRDERYYDGEHSIHPMWTYPALRSRPGDIRDINVDDGTGSVVVTKCRDRAAGGVFGLSQLFWPIFRSDLKRDLAEMLISNIERQTNMKLITPEVYGVKAYLELFQEDPEVLAIFDTSLAERLEAQISDLPTAANLSMQGFPKKLGFKKFSGISSTRTDQYITEPFLILAAVKLGFLSKANHYYFGGDNWACPTEEPIPEEIHDVLSPSSRWLGHDPLLKAISGFKLTTDSADKSQNWTDRMTKFGMSQSRSGVVRLTRTLIGMNLIPELMTLEQFLNKVAESKVDVIDLHEGEPYHHLMDEPLRAKELIDTSPELEHACHGVFEIAQQMNVPYKLVDDIKSPLEPTFHKV
jgi:hypothetical protein